MSKVMYKETKYKARYRKHSAYPRGPFIQVERPEKEIFRGDLNFRRNVANFYFEIVPQLFVRINLMYSGVKRSMVTRCT